MNKQVIIAIASLFTLYCSCTNEEMENAKAPYMGEIRFSVTGTPVDSLYIIAERVVDYTSYAMAHDINRGNGRFIYNRPSTVSNKKNRRLSAYPVKIGCYVVSGINCSYKDFGYSYMDEIMSGAGTSRLLLEQRTYSLADAEIISRLPKGSIVTPDKWNDHNPYSNYVTPLSKDVVQASSELYDVGRDEAVDIAVAAESKSLNLTIQFTITKDMSDTPFRVTMVETELAGIPNTLEIYSGLIDYGRTYKVFYPTSPVTPDTYDATEVRCSGTLRALSLVTPKSASMSNGPGILQIMVHVETQDGKRKVLSGKINLYNTITREEITEVTDNDMLRNLKTEATLSIEADCLLSSSAITGDITQVTGIDAWQGTGEEIVVESDNPEELTN